MCDSVKLNVNAQDVVSSEVDFSEGGRGEGGMVTSRRREEPPCLPPTSSAA